MAANKYKVPLAKWRQWDERAQRTFNGLFDDMKSNQHLFLHPQQEALSNQKWRTVAWNASWIAADYACDRRHENVYK